MSVGGPVSGAPFDPGSNEESWQQPLSDLLEAGPVVGRGGMGEVRLGWDPILNRQVAIKTKHPDASAKRFKEEAALTARLEHAAIVPVHGIGEDQAGGLFYTMRHIQGRTLHECIQGDMDPTDLLRGIRTVCEAVAYAHSQGIVHRDLTPNNVIFSDYGQVFVVDWGLATRSGQAQEPGVGTAGFAPPEQQHPGLVHPSADVYGLGRLIHTALGETPMGDALGAIIEQATTPDPDRRYADGSALLADLDAYLDGGLVSAHQYTPRDYLAWAFQRWRAPIVTASGFVCLGMVSAIVAGVNITHERDRAFVAEQVALDERERALENLATAYTAQAQTAANGGQRAESELYAAAALTLHESPVARGVLSRFALQPAPAIHHSHRLKCPDATLSSEGHHLMCNDGAELVWRDSAGTVLATHQTTADELLGQGAFLPTDPPSYVFLTPAAVWQWQLDTTPTTIAHRAIPIDRQVLPVDTHTVAIIGNGEHFELNIKGGDWRQVHCARGGNRLARYAPNGTFVQACAWGDLVAHSRDKPPRRWPLDGTLISAMSTDGQRIFVARSSGDLEIYDIDTGQMRTMTRASKTSALAVAASKQWLAVADIDGGIELWSLSQGTLLHRIPARAEGLAWTDEGHLRVVSPHRLDTWQVPAPTVGLRSPSGIAGQDISPDGHWLATAHGDGSVRLRSLTGTDQGFTFQHGPGVAKDVAFSRDGTHLATVSAKTPEVVFLDLAGNPLARHPIGIQRRIEAVGPATFLTLSYDGKVSILTQHGLQNQRSTPDAPVESYRSHDGGVVILLRGGEITDQDSGKTIIVAPGAQSIARESKTWMVARQSEVLTQAENGGGLQSLLKTRSPVLDLAGTHDGETWAGGMLDGAIVVFQPDGTLLGILEGHESRVSQVGFTPDGTQLLSSGWDGETRRWDMAVLRGSPQALAQRLVGQWGRSIEDIIEEQQEQQTFQTN